MVQYDIIKSEKKYIYIQNQEEKTSSPSVFFSGLGIVFSVTGREQLKPDLGVALPMSDENLFPQITHV